MRYEEILENLKEALAIRFHDKGIYQRKIAEILQLSPSVVCRRLSGQSRFTLEEIAGLCEALHIPPEEIFTGCNPVQVKSAEFFQPGFTSSTHEQLVLFNGPVEVFLQAAQFTDCTLYVTCNMFPTVVTCMYEWMRRFSGLQSLYFYKGLDGIRPLLEVEHSAGERELMEQYVSDVHGMRKTVYIISNRVVQNYISDMKRFYLNGYINREEVKWLVSDVEDLLVRFERMCARGYMENGNPVEVYYSDSFIPSDSYLVQGDGIRFGVYFMSPLTYILTRSTEGCNKMLTSFDFLKSSAIRISQSGAHLMYAFLNRQREVVGAFKTEVGI
ncbi:MAG: helix-turn-helix domain-containing protein [Tannerellaceae bacterium]|nr:helix-turn-helix domain-containing protein [Tannerellaceae bacterium]